MSKFYASIVRHILTAVSSYLVLKGVDNWIPVMSWLIDNLDQISSFLTPIIGGGGAILGFRALRNTENS